MWTYNYNYIVEDEQTDPIVEETELYHYGVPGMKWGVRHDYVPTGGRPSGGRPSSGRPMGVVRTAKKKLRSAKADRRLAKKKFIRSAFSLNIKKNMQVRKAYQNAKKEVRQAKKGVKNAKAQKKVDNIHEKALKSKNVDKKEMKLAKKAYKKARNKAWFGNAFKVGTRFREAKAFKKQYKQAKARYKDSKKAKLAK